MPGPLGCLSELYRSIRKGVEDMLRSVVGFKVARMATTPPHTLSGSIDEEDADVQVDLLLNEVARRAVLALDAYSFKSIVPVHY